MRCLRDIALLYSNQEEYSTWIEVNVSIDLNSPTWPDVTDHAPPWATAGNRVRIESFFMAPAIEQQAAALRMRRD